MSGKAGPKVASPSALSARIIGRREEEDGRNMIPQTRRTRRADAVNNPVITLAIRICGALLFVCSASCSSAAAEAAERHSLVQDQVNWAAFLARHDLVWNRPGKNYFEAPFVGNGLVGAMIWQDSDHTLRLSVGRTDVTDHNLWWRYRHTMDDRFLRERLYPLLRRAVNPYLHLAEKGSDGKYHLPPSHSPEAFSGPDTNYDLASLRWGCETLLWIDRRLGTNDPLAARGTTCWTIWSSTPSTRPGTWAAPARPLPVATATGRT